MARRSWWPIRRLGFARPAKSLSNLHDQAAELARKPTSVAVEYLLDVIKTVGHGSSVKPAGTPNSLRYLGQGSNDHV